MQNVVILGSTGSIGCNTLAIIKHHLNEYKVYALTGFLQVDKLLEQCIEFNPKYAFIPNIDNAKYLQEKITQQGGNTKVLHTKKDMLNLVSDGNVDIVMSAIVGSAGLQPTYAAITASKKVLLANKESMVIAGGIINQALKQSKATLIPVDSEHSAIFQCLPQNSQSHQTNGINKIILTASGGPFLNTSKSALEAITPDAALKHPNWVMGRKITIDSSTLMNKGLELIEAHWLFNMPTEKIEVLIHPQSIIHSMVEYIDGSVLAQLGTPDMKTPIAYALAYPKRIETYTRKLDFAAISQLTFAVPDLDKFPCLNLAIEALKLGGVQPAILNAANEVAVAAFLDRKLAFYGINQLIEKTMQHFSNFTPSSIEEIIDIDRQARDYAATHLST